MFGLAFMKASAASLMVVSQLHTVTVDLPSLDPELSLVDALSDPQAATETIMAAAPSNATDFLIGKRMSYLSLP